MPKAPPPSILLKFNGRLEWPLEPGVDDWGLTPDQQESYVEQFRRILAAKNAWREDQHDFFQLRRFLRARSYDLEKATAMWLNNVAFKAEFKVDTILQDFLYDERDSFLRAYPQGYHKVDKQGRPIFIQLLGQLDIHKLKQITTEQRMVKYHIQEYERCIKVIMPVCSHLAGRHIDTTFGIMDVKGVGMSHLTGETKRLMGLITKYDQDNYPELLGHICIINAPSVFRMIWGVVKGMLDARTQGKIEILGTDYLPGLLKWVDINNLPEFLGGRSKGSLLEDIGPWSDHDVLARLGLSDDQLRLGHCPAPSVSNMSRRSSSMVHSDGDRLASHGSMRRPSEGNHHHVGAPHDLVRLSESDGYQSPGGSTDAQNSFRANNFRLTAGITPELLEESQRRYAGSLVSSMPSRSPSLSSSSVGANGLSPGNHPGANQPSFAAIPEGGGPSKRASAAVALSPAIQGMEAGRGLPRPRSLVDRVEALEKVLPPHMSRLRDAVQDVASEQQAATGNQALGGVGGAASSRTAPEGSLLNRLEVLEEAMETLLIAQQASLLYQQQLVQDQAKQPSQCCCCIM